MAFFARLALAKGETSSNKVGKNVRWRQLRWLFGLSGQKVGMGLFPLGLWELLASRTRKIVTHYAKTLDFSKRKHYNSSKTKKVQTNSKVSINLSKHFFWTLCINFFVTNFQFFISLASWRASPSGKALDCDSIIRGFESRRSPKSEIKALKTLHTVFFASNFPEGILSHGGYQGTKDLVMTL